MPVVLQVLITGLASGSVISLVALGLSLVLGLTRTLPFAQGDLVVAAPALAVLVVLGSTPVAVNPAMGASLLVIVATVTLAVAGSLLTYAVGVRPHLDGRRSTVDPLRSVVAALGLALLLRAGVAQAFPRGRTAVPDPLHLGTGVLHLGDGVTAPVRSLEVTAIAVVLAVLVERGLARGRFRRELRAVSDGAGLAGLCGIDGRRVMAVGFAVAGLLAGGAGLLGLPGGQGITADGGVSLGLSAAAAAWAAGAGRLPGAVLAGLALGLVQAAVGQLADPGPRLSDLVPATVLVVVVAARAARPRPVA